MFYLPTRHPEDWRVLLAGQKKHWRTGYSAKALAHCWQSSGGLPDEVRSVLNSPGSPLVGIQPLIALPEHKVDLPGGAAASQNDIWILARCNQNLVSIAVEGKVEEPFGETVSKWNPGSTPGHKERFEFLRNTLELDCVPGTIRYQLLHRTASAVMEAVRFLADHALLLIHSFSIEDRSLEDYQAYVQLFGLSLAVNEIGSKKLVSGISLHSAWVRGNPKYLEF